MNENRIGVPDSVFVQLVENALESAWWHGATRHHYIAELKAYAG